MFNFILAIYLNTYKLRIIKNEKYVTCIRLVKKYKGLEDCSSNNLKLVCINCKKREKQKIPKYNFFL